jgi:hypothetical protein
MRLYLYLYFSSFCYSVVNNVNDDGEREEAVLDAKIEVLQKELTLKTNEMDLKNKEIAKLQKMNNKFKKNSGQTAINKRTKGTQRFVMGVAGGLAAATIAYTQRDKIEQMLGYEDKNVSSNTLASPANHTGTPVKSISSNVLSFLKFLILVTLVLVLILLCTFK